MPAITHPRLPPRRGGTRHAWWAKAWLRAVEEAAFGVSELRHGRRLASGGHVGAITTEPGRAVAAVIDGDDAWSVTVTVPVLGADDATTLVELVAAESGRIGALSAGDLPLPLVEAMEEAGVELLPYGAELGSSCGCQAWLDPCPHAIAVLLQLGRLLSADPFVLLGLRGLPREELLARLHERVTRRSRGDAEADDAGADDPDLALAEDAAARAARILARLEESDADLGDLL